MLPSARHDAQLNYAVSREGAWEHPDTTTTDDQALQHMQLLRMNHGADAAGCFY